MNEFKAGVWRKSGANTAAEYSYFLPNLLPEKIEFKDESIPKLLEEANQHLGELNAFGQFAPDVDFFISMHELKEATQSSAIEGTQTGMDEAILKIEDISPENRDDWTEVQNYISAMRYAIARLNDLPLSMRLLSEVHKELLTGVRGERKTPGEIRRSQNWIGGSSIKDARFIPPSIEHLPELLSDMEKYMNIKAVNTPHLIKVALIHYQFETIHPFLDGNGRLGRLLIVLYLLENKKLTKPILYLSDYFSRYKSSYYAALEAVRRENDIDHWVKFFLVAVAEMSKKSCSTLQEIIALKNRNIERVSSLGKRAKHAVLLLKHMYSSPAVNVKEVADVLQVSNPTAHALVNSLVDIGILKEITGYARNRIFVYEAYLDLFVDRAEG